ncbi:hypothetical protein ACLKA6_003127 [Drosophila palustris]
MDKKLLNLIDGISKEWASEQFQRERRELQKLLEQSPPAMNLRAILKFYGANYADLATGFYQVCDSIEQLAQGRVKVYPYGSLATGLSLKDSDIDLYLEQVDHYMPHCKLFNKTFSSLDQSDCFSRVIRISSARVPIIRCRHVESGINVDINMSTSNGTHNSRFVNKIVNLDVRLREQFLFLKMWAKNLRIIRHGGMTSYCLITLIIYQLQTVGFLPAIRKLQNEYLMHNVGGINYAFDLSRVKTLPISLSSFQLICTFFQLYSQYDFKNKLLSPFLATALNLDTDWNSNFAEYNSQLKALQSYHGLEYEQLPIDCCLCVQDPFDLTRNVAQSVNETSLIYFQHCLKLSAEACENSKWKSSQKLYEYLMFGIAEQLIQMTLVVEPETQIETTLSLEHLLTPTKNDLKKLKTLIQTDNGHSKLIYNYWSEFYVAAIKDILLNIYKLHIVVIDSESDSITWFINGSLDTWTSRHIQRISKQSFFADQQRETLELIKTRSMDAKYAVNLNGLFSISITADCKELRLQLQPWIDDDSGRPDVQLHRLLTNLFRNLRNMLSNYDIWQSVKHLQYQR